MYNESFHKWTLTFFRKDDEQLYQSSLLKGKINVFRIVCFGFGLSFLFLFLSAYLSQGVNEVSISAGLVFGISIILLMLSLRLRVYINWLFIILFIVNMSSIIYYAVLADQIQSLKRQGNQYMMGHNQCYVACVILYHIEYKKRIILLFSLVFFQLGFLKMLNTADAIGIGMSLFCCILMGFFCYSFEYQQRQNFDFSQKLRQLKDLLMSSTNDHLFVVSFNEAIQGFVLEFSNQQSKEFLGVVETDSLKRFLREAFLIPKDIYVDSNVNFSQDGLLKNILSNKITLEEKLFSCITNMEEVDQELTLVLSNHNYKQIKLKVKSYHHEKPIFVIMSKQNDVQELLKTHQNLIKTMQQMIVKLQQEIVNSGLNLFKEVKRIQTKQILNNFNSLNFLGLSVINKLKNASLFYEIDKVYRSQLQFIQQINLQQYFDQLICQFDAYANMNQITFEFQNYLNKEFLIILNPDFLTQIIMNLFEYSISLMTDKKQTILMKIKLLKQSSYLNFYYNDTAKSSRSSSILPYMKIIKFSFQFKTTQAIALEPNLFKINQCKLKTIGQFHFHYFITTVLLDMLGPTNTIKNHQQLDEACSEFHNKITFFIYTDQSKIDPSFYKFNKDNLFQSLFGE